MNGSSEQRSTKRGETRISVPTAGDLTAVRTIPSLARIDPARLSNMIGVSSVRTIPAGAPLFTIGSEVEGLAILLQGQLAAFAPIDGDLAMIELISPVNCVVESSLFGDRHHAMAIDAIVDSRILIIPLNVFMVELRINDRLRIGLLGGLAARLRGLVGQIERLKLHSGSQRLAAFLLGLAMRQHGSTPIELPCEKRLLARMLGMTPVSFSRSLRDLRSVGIAADRGQRIVIDDLGKLRDFVARITGEETARAGSAVASSSNMEAR